MSTLVLSKNPFSTTNLQEAGLKLKFAEAVAREFSFLQPISQLPQQLSMLQRDIVMFVSQSELGIRINSILEISPDKALNNIDPFKYATGEYGEDFFTQDNSPVSAAFNMNHNNGDLMKLIEELSEFLIPNEIIYKDEAAQKADEIVDSVLGNRMRAPITRSISKQIKDICIGNMGLYREHQGIPPLIFSFTNQVIPVGLTVQENDVISLAVLVASS